jgi:6-phosphogluconolactonase
MVSSVFPAKAQAPASPPHSGSIQSVLYASMGDELTQYDVDVNNAALTKRASVKLPADVQEAWPHPSGHYLYVAWSNGGPTAVTPTGSPVASGSTHGVTSFRIDSATGALSAFGQPVKLPARPIFTTADISGTHLLVAFNEPSGVNVYRIGADGALGAVVEQKAALDTGIYAHQVRVDPSNQMVILITRGNGPAGGKPEDPGALKVFSYKDGLLANRASIAPGGGFNFQPRHLDFHPSKPWVFVTLERQNKVQVYAKLKGDTLSAEPLFSKDPFPETARGPSGQAVSTIHMHPNGRFVYAANRAGGTVAFEGKRVFAGGENSIAVFAINQETGEPGLIQNADTRGFQPRTFSIDPSGRLLVVANQGPMLKRDGNGTSRVPAGLSVFRIQDDGKLEFARKYDVETPGSSSLFWTGFTRIR